MGPLVTVVICSCDDERYVGNAILSALTQTHKDVEVLVLDEASADGSLEIIRGFRDPRLRTIAHTEKIGAARNHNAGFRLAQGEFITFLAACDLLLPTCIEDGLAFLQRYRGVDISYACAGVIDSEGTILRRLRKPAFDGHLHTGRNEFASLLLSGDNIILPTALFPVSLRGEVGLLDESLERRPFYEYYLRLAAAGKRFGYFSRPEALVRAHGKSEDVSRAEAIEQHMVAVQYVERNSGNRLAGYAQEIGAALTQNAATTGTEAYIRQAAGVTERIPAISSSGSAQPLISVVVPYTGRLGLLAQALDTVAGQRYDKWEAIVVADGTADPGGLIDHMGLTQRVRIASTERPAGAAAARNLGISCVSGEIVTYLDEDNRFEAGYLSALARAFADPAITVIAGKTRIAVIGDNGCVYHVRQSDVGTLEDGRLSLVSNRLPLNAVAHRRFCVTASGLFNPELPLLEDWDFLIRLSSKFPVTPITQPACILCFDSRLEGHELFSRRTSQGWRAFAACVQVIYDRHPPRSERERTERAAYAQSLQTVIQKGVRSAGNTLAIMEFVEQLAGL